MNGLIKFTTFLVILIVVLSFQSGLRLANPEALKGDDIIGPEDITIAMGSKINIIGDIYDVGTDLLKVSEYNALKTDWARMKWADGWKCDHFDGNGYCDGAYTIAVN